MNKPRYAWKIGVFVIVSLVFAGSLIMKFSKGASFFTKTYVLRIKADDVGGIIPGAVVLMAGVPIGNVTETELQPDGKSVTIKAQILQKYRIHRDAIFGIKQSGFLGDRFISVVPTENKLPVLENNDTVQCEEAFDLQEVAKSTSGLIKRVDQTVQQLNVAVARLDRTVLAENTLTNITATLLNFRTLSEQALVTLDRIDNFARTNLPVLSTAVTNFTDFTGELNQVAQELQQTVASNKLGISKAIKNLDSATLRVNEIAAGIQEGHGLAGTVLKDEQLARDLTLTVSNLNVLSSNINHRGLWSVIRKPKLPKN